MMNFFGGGGGGGHHGGPGAGGGGAQFMRSYEVYSPVFIDREDIKKGNKIILPPSALNELARLHITYPMQFRIVNPIMKKKTFCGVLEFVAEEGRCYMPRWMMENLMLDDGAEVILTNVTLNKGSHIKIQPHKTAFIDLSNPKTILENELTNYSCLQEGEDINISYQGIDYLIRILECKPDKQISIVEADLNLEFGEPLDYKDIPLKKSASSAKRDEEKNILDKVDLSKYQYKRVDGKQLTKKQLLKMAKKDLDAKEAEDKEKNFDPRQHRLKHGIRHWKKKHDLGFTGTGFSLKG